MDRVPLARTFQIDPVAIMECYDLILLHSTKNQYVSAMKYKEQLRIVLSPEYKYFGKRKENRTSEVDFCKMTSYSQQIASFWQHSSIQWPLFAHKYVANTLLRRLSHWIDIFGHARRSDPTERRVPLHGSAAWWHAKRVANAPWKPIVIW